MYSHTLTGRQTCKGLVLLKNTDTAFDRWKLSKKEWNQRLTRRRTLRNYLTERTLEKLTLIIGHLVWMFHWKCKWETFKSNQGDSETIAHHSNTGTFGCPEVDRLRQRPNTFGIFGLNPKVINCVQVQIHHLVSQPVPADGLHHPVVYWDVLIHGVIQDIAWNQAQTRKSVKQFFNTMWKNCTFQTTNGQFIRKNKYICRAEQFVMYLYQSLQGLFDLSSRTTCAELIKIDALTSETIAQNMETVRREPFPCAFKLTYKQLKVCVLTEVLNLA